MSPEATTAAIRRELGTQDLSQVFEWIDLDKPLGSASIAQVRAAAPQYAMMSVWLQVVVLVFTR
jgi:predicted unusual protein kinase regulating ubiquinone biosynthesis (AarF/ABC1/UbiB family)